MEPAKPNREASSSQDVQEFVVRIPKDKNKRFHVMKFNGSHKIDVTKWRNQSVKMERENNYKEFKLDEDMPKYGAGSEFGRDLKDEARRKKHGILTKQYNPDDQPWILKLGGKGGKKYKGIREGGVTENASYYVFTQATDGMFEAHPVEEWYNFSPIQCFKALTAEEAEEEFGRRDKVLNYFSIMVKKKLQTDAGEDDDDEEKKSGGKKKKKKARKEFKITDMDEWIHDLDDSGESENEDDDEDEGKPKKSAKKGEKKKKKENKSDDEAMEESDEGDFDDKEVDYITSSSGSEEEIGEEEKTNRELKGVEDEEALRKLMSDEEEEEVEEENKETEEGNEVKEKAAEPKTKQKQKKSDDTSGESSSDSSDSDFDDPKFTSAIFVPQNAEKTKKKSGSDNSAGSSRANTPTKTLSDKDGSKAQKRRFPEPVSSSNKKQKLQSTTDGPSTSSYNSTLDGINVETVRRYLQRKPMTASELLRKFKSKKTKMSSDQLVNKITDVLKKIPLQKTNIKGKMYLSLKTA